MLRAVLIAPPGAGKGTQGDRIAKIYGVPHISSGDVLRSEVTRRTPLGERIATELEHGDLVDDGLVSSVIFKRMAESPGGYILDGFPRTVGQALATEKWTVDAGLPLHAAVELEVPHEELINRIRHRSAELPRSDDAQQIVLHRLDVYDRETSELLSFYEQRGILVAVDGTGDVDAVTRRIQHRLDRVLAS